MAKVNIGSNAFLYPMPVVLVGAQVDGKVNFMTVAWTTRVNFKPPLAAVCISKTHHTARGIAQTQQFSINIPSAAMVQQTDYCGIVSGKSKDKSTLFEVFYGELAQAPMIADCPLTMECRLQQTVDLPSNFVFIGEIVHAYAEESCLTDGNPDIKKIDPVVLTMPDNGYWAVGDYVAKAWSVGKKAKAVS